nr:aspartyl/asparaginyl beta-hydroxylase domain-containing protein [Streptomyces sp. SID13588]
MLLSDLPTLPAGHRQWVVQAHLDAAIDEDFDRLDFTLVESLADREEEDVSQLAPMPAAATRLNVMYDQEALRAELNVLQVATWPRQSTYRDGIGVRAEIDWRSLSLRSLGGHADRTDPGGPGMEEFADTTARLLVGAASRLLDQVPSPKRAVRYMALGPGAESNIHADTKCGPRWGVARLHAPVVTSDGAVLMLDGTEYQWQPGQLWFGDFSRPHKVANLGHEVRIHLVIDVLVTAEITSIFPSAWANYLDSGDVLYNRRPEPRPGPAEDWSCELALPAGFLTGADPADVAAWEETVRADVRPLPDDGLALVAETGQRVRLVHVRSGEFRYAGWSEERTVVLPAGGQPPMVIVRDGRSVFAFTMVARPPQKDVRLTDVPSMDAAARAVARVAPGLDVDTRRNGLPG